MSRVMSIAGGDLGTQETLNIMRALAYQGSQKSNIVALARDLYILCDCERCIDCVVDTVDYWIRQHFVYTPEDIETIKAPEYSLNEIETTGVLRGDCDDVSTFFAAIIKAYGLPVRFNAIRTKQNDAYAHVYTEVQLPALGKWKSYDATVPLHTALINYGSLIAYV